jgi:hypothetical protein
MKRGVCRCGVEMPSVQFFVGGYFVKTISSFLGFEKILDQDVLLILEFFKNQRFFDFQIFKQNWRLSFYNEITAQPVFYFLNSMR